MQKPIFLVGGGKGGVGKSLFTVALVDHAIAIDGRPFLIETDTSVPDVYKAYRDEIDAELVNLDEREGWIELLNVVESRPENTIVINTGARNQTGINNFGKTLRTALPQLKRRLVVFWMIDRKREGLELLGDFTEALPEATINVVRNMYFGREGKFEVYNTSKAREMIEQRGGRSLNFPELADRVTDAMNKSRLTVGKAVQGLSFGDRMEVERWRDECKEMFAEVIRE
jgi:hypothetical protein